MKRILWCVLCIAAVMLGACIAGCTGSEAAPADGQATVEERPLYIVGVDGEYPPYTYIDKEGKFHGLDVDSIRWIAEKKGFDVEIQAIAWDGIIPALNAGKIDMVYSGMTITDERKEKVSFSIPYMIINQSFAVHDESEVTLDDIMAGNAVIGAQRGTTGAFWVEENLVETGLMPEENLKLYDNFPLVVTDLGNKRIDASIYDRPPHMKAIEGKPLHIIGEIYTGEEYGVAIRKEDTALLATINDGLTMLMNDPYWDELLVQYEMN
ncbi:MAG: amino acid ABC transporter substrate-binding protein [Methanomicrobiales archaeon]|nr:amino acid ABC transporter substrate-binding protein [Methanomicrobiales archaeon]